MKSRDAKLGCRGERKILLAYLDGALETIERLAFDRHLEGCRDCRDAVRFEQEIEEALHRDAGIDFDAGFEQRVVAAVNRTLDSAPPIATRRSRRSQSTLRRIAVATFAAVGLAAAIAVAVALGRRGDADRATPPRNELVVAPPSAHESPAPLAPPETVESFDPARIEAARSTVKAALVAAAAIESSDGFASEFQVRVAPLVGERWPIEELVRGTIDDADPAVATAAIRGVVELRMTGALPALRRASRRGATTGPALVALGALGDIASLPQLQRALLQPSLAASACDGLRRLGDAAAAASLARALDDVATADAALAALLAMGEPGVRELLRRAERGDLVANDALDAGGLPTLAQLDSILRSSGDDELIAAAIHRSARHGDAALSSLLHVAPLRGRHASRHASSQALDAIVSIGTDNALRALLAAGARGTLPRSDAHSAVRRTLAGFLDPSSAAIRMLGGEHGGELLAALAAGDDADEEGLAILAAITEHLEVPLERRVDAAYALADRDALPPGTALAIAGEAMLRSDASLAGRALLAAARSGALDDGTLASVLGDARSSSSIGSKVTALASRWRRDGEPPAESERDVLERRLERVLPPPEP